MFNSYSRMIHSCENVIKFLLSEDPFEIEMLITQLSEINEKRKSLTDEYYKRLIIQIVKDDPIIVLEDKSINSGLCGLVANKISTEFKKTTFVIGDGVGSGRGPNALALLEQKKGYFSNFGGHAEACGFTLKEQKFDLNNVVIPKYILKQEKYIKINYNDIEKLYNIIEKISPMPKKPLFYSEEEVVEISHMKKIHSKIKTKNMTFLYFYKIIPIETKIIKISFQLSKNIWNKKIEYQGIIQKLF
jgi:single-stranded DNA-specific DHH superfamily exonuclease